jgi:hypothetical protein
MKKQLLILGFAAVTALGTAQTARISLLEHFTGENCSACASSNPEIQTTLDLNTTKMVAIKWQGNIPSAPTATWSQYQTNKTENDWRYRSTASGGYGYAISSSPQGRVDGQGLTVFGAPNNNTGYLSSTLINAAQSVTSPFILTMQRSWDPGMTVFTVTVSITAAQTFTCAGPLIFRLVMVEKKITYATSPGSNGETVFYHTARRSFPTLQNGTSLPTSWTLGQNQTFTIACTAPSNIVSKPEVECIGFIQDDATKRVQQAGITRAPNDAQAMGMASNYMNCGTTYTPAVKVYNAGFNTISTMTILPIVDGVPGTPFAWSGSLASNSTATITMPSISPTTGAHTYSMNITAVNGTTDDYPSNNTKLGTFALTNTVIAAPIIQTFSLSTFPPTNWYRNNQDNGTFQFSRIPNVGAYAISPLGAVKYNSWDNPNVGDRDELYLPDASLTGLSNMKLTFDVAHSPVTGKTEGLDVLVSTNCGASWTNVYSKYGTILATAPASTVQFTPLGTQWRSEVVNLSAYDNMPNVMVKFMPYNAYGNNIWLDNINLVSTTDLKSTVSEFSAIEVYPNPAQNEATLRITTLNGGENTITMINTLGQVLIQKTISVDAGSTAISLDTKDLSSGIYHVVVSDKSGYAVTKKLIINK